MSVFEQQAFFMKAMGNRTEETSTSQATLYLRLTCEEFGELLCAANPENAKTIKALIDALTLFASVTPDAHLGEMFDGVIDTLVTTIGVGVSMNFPMQEGWREVLRTNMAKVGPDGKVTRRADGKVLKPEGWKPPNLNSILRNFWGDRS